MALLPLNNSSLHHVIVRSLVDHGYAPTSEELASHFGVNKKKIAAALSELQDYHGVVLHSHCPEVWVVHPFSTAPTNFLVRKGSGYGGVIAPGVRSVSRRYWAAMAFASIAASGPKGFR